MLGWGAVVVPSASASKSGGAYLGARLAALPAREGLALGGGLNARGAVEIVVATVGLSLGVLNPASYAVVVLLAVATSMMAPPLLRLVLRGWRGSEEEQARLARERLLGGNLLVRDSRVLLPSHGGPNSVLAARIVDLAWPEGAEVTVLAAGADVPEEDLARVRAVLAKRPIAYEHGRARSRCARSSSTRASATARSRSAPPTRASRARWSRRGRRAPRGEPAARDHGAARARDSTRSRRSRFRRMLVPAVGTHRAAPRRRWPTASRVTSTRGC